MINDLRKEHKYKDALALFKSKKSDFSYDEITGNEYLVSNILYCLRDINQIDYGFLFIKEYEIEINHETNTRVLNAYGWLLWSKYKEENKKNDSNDHKGITPFNDEGFDVTSNSKYEKSETISKIEEIIPLLNKNDDDYSKNLISNLFSIVVKYEKDKPAINWELLNNFCNCFNPNELSAEYPIYEVERKGRKQNKEFASDLEKWYVIKTKALEKLERWEECSELSLLALNSLKKFHDSDDIWFARRIALAKKNIGSPKDAIEELKNILKNKNEWFIQKEIADIYFEINEKEDAFKYAIEAITNYGSLEYKINLLFLIGKLLKEKDEKELAFKHFYLTKMIREKEKWKIPQNLLEELGNHDIAKESINDLDKLKSELNKFWQSFITKNNETQKSELFDGVIVNFLNDNERGKDGFLRSGGNDYYFKLSVNYHLTSEIGINTKVSFELKPSMDGKKDQAIIRRIID